ncbi:hypothetical protein CPT_MyoSmar_017 [Serratia phage MyoSmar]|uniref:Thioredoxin n=2 Tax=Myosmarvirus TaxID=2843428 RepID=A0A5B9NA26_9CAUD|nr:hypothetical protein HWC56_gp017 [Serratia phage MyoSmar]QEG09466.1 hypothetical protein CPT_MyoSmar_017 [Serratia phage MyoSmar]
MPKAEDIIYDKMMELVNRREKACKIQPACPQCSTKQVQIIDWYTAKVKFKCRQCKCRFELLITKEGNKHERNRVISRRGADGRFSSGDPRDESGE